MKKDNLYKFYKIRKSNRILIYCFFVTLLLTASTYKESVSHEVTIEEQTTKPIETSFNLNALPFPDSRILRVAIYNEPNTTVPSYTTVFNAGTSTNNITKVIEILSVDPRIQTTILFEADIINHFLTAARFDVLIVPDVHPRESILDLIHDYWLAGGGILALDGSALFLNLLGILPPEAIGTDGNGVYWNYNALGFNFTIRHPTTKGYTIDSFIELSPGYNYFGWDWSALSGSSVASNMIPLAHDFDDANIITALAMDRDDKGGKVVTISNDLTNRYSTEIDQLIRDSVDWLTPRPKGKILFDYTHHPYYSIDPWDSLAHYAGKYTTFRDNLVSRDYIFDKLYPVTTGLNISLPKLAPYDMLIIVTPDIGYNYTLDEIASIETWVADGGALFVAGENPNSLPNEVTIINDLLAPYDLEINNGNVVQTTYTGLVQHPVSEGALSLNMISNGYINITGNAFGIWYDASFSNIVMAGDTHGNGRIILTGDINWFDNTYIVGAHNEIISISVANWLTAATAKVLVYTDWFGTPNSYFNPVVLALNDLGIKYHLTIDVYYFNLTLHEHAWEMVIIANSAVGGLNTYFDDIIEYVDSGGHLILSTYIMDNYSSNPIWARLGTQFNADYTIDPDLFIWDAGHPIFTQPHLYTQNKFVVGTPYIDDGDTVFVYSNATALAGFTSSAAAGEVFITLRNDEQTLFNSFLIDEFTGDYDDSTYSDNYELWKNEIAYIMRPKLDFAINVPLENYVEDTVTLTTEIANIGLTGCPIGYIELALATDMSTTDDLEQNYTLPEGANVELTWAVTCDVVQNVTISFEASYTGFLGTAYSTEVMYFDIHFLERPSGFDWPWYYYVAAAGGLLLLILIIVIAVSIRKKKRTPTR